VYIQDECVNRSLCSGSYDYHEKQVAICGPIGKSFAISSIAIQPPPSQQPGSSNIYHPKPPYQCYYCDGSGHYFSHRMNYIECFFSKNALLIQTVTENNFIFKTIEVF
jgi:hypothetical protein